MQLVKEYWPQLLALLAFVVWVVRMEASVQANARELRRLQHQRNEDQAAHREARASTNSMLAEVRTDIKELLRRKE
ncbi:DUF2852 domain-containing protein [Ketogulonicigenium vulgare]|uniref:DUF2852 domain-containing protein n=1 Tax=Ketogulonicigenium vulgare TaxID=92945 RepID=UPI0023593707|nr:hypothetical protein [Ketogulonicigenium vulgare]